MEAWSCTSTGGHPAGVVVQALILVAARSPWTSKAGSRWWTWSTVGAGTVAWKSSRRLRWSAVKRVVRGWACSWPRTCR